MYVDDDGCLANLSIHVLYPVCVMVPLNISLILFIFPLSYSLSGC